VPRFSRTPVRNRDDPSGGRVRTSGLGVTRRFSRRLTPPRWSDGRPLRRCGNQRHRTISTAQKRNGEGKPRARSQCARYPGLDDVEGGSWMRKRHASFLVGPPLVLVGAALIACPLAVDTSGLPSSPPPAVTLGTFSTPTDGHAPDSSVDSPVDSF